MLELTCEKVSADNTHVLKFSRQEMEGNYVTIQIQECCLGYSYA